MDDESKSKPRVFLREIAARHKIRRA